MKAKIGLLFVLAAAIAVAAPGNTSWANGSFAPDTKNEYRVVDALVVFWPKMGVAKNVLEINLLAERLKPADRDYFVSNQPALRQGELDAFFSRSGGKNVESVQRPPRFQLQIFYGQTPPRTFQSGTMSGAGSTFYFSPGRFRSGSLPLSLGYGAGPQPTVTLNDGLKISVKGDVREDGKVDVQAQYTRKDPKRYEKWDFHVVSTLIVANM